MLEEIKVDPISTNSVNVYKQDLSVLEKKASDLVIKNQASYDFAAEIRKDLKRCQLTMDEARKNITRPLDAAKKAVMDLFRPVESGLELAIKNVDSKLLSYDAKMELIRKTEEDKLRRQAEAEEARKKSALEERARKAEEKGNALKAEELRTKAEEVRVVAPTLAPMLQKPSGLSYAEYWKGEVVDLKELVKAIAAGRAPITFITINQAVINKQATASRDSLKFPGIRFYSEKRPVGR